MGVSENLFHMIPEKDHMSHLILSDTPKFAGQLTQHASSLTVRKHKLNFMPEGDSKACAGLGYVGCASWRESTLNRHPRTARASF